MSTNQPAVIRRSCEDLPVSDHERIACGLHIASRELSSALVAAVQGHGLNGMEANLLLKLDLGLDSPSEIATYLGVDASNLSRLMRQMEKEKLIRREVDEENRSRVIITLTARGKKLASKIKPDVRAMEREVLVSLSRSELTQLKMLLKKMCTSLLASRAGRD